MHIVHRNPSSSNTILHGVLGASSYIIHRPLRSMVSFELIACTSFLVRLLDIPEDKGHGRTIVCASRGHSLLAIPSPPLAACFRIWLVSSPATSEDAYHSKYKPWALCHCSMPCVGYSSKSVSSSPVGACPTAPLVSVRPQKHIESSTTAMLRLALPVGLRMSSAYKIEQYD